MGSAIQTLLCGGLRTSVSLEDGTIRGFDTRAATSNSASESHSSVILHAHEEAASPISYNPLAPDQHASWLAHLIGMLKDF
ncbi:hypothetical protein BT93_H0741 [Corymbia citriodora subsp. variegata]|nr:hypothetical protein BT93_H0741 [Corymbia citriodora subsp. variegata]